MSNFFGSFVGLEALQDLARDHTEDGPECSGKSNGCARCAAITVLSNRKPPPRPQPPVSEAIEAQRKGRALKFKTKVIRDD